MIDWRNITWVVVKGCWRCKRDYKQFATNWMLRDPVTGRLIGKLVEVRS